MISIKHLIRTQLIPSLEEVLGVKVYLWKAPTRGQTVSIESISVEKDTTSATQTQYVSIALELYRGAEITDDAVDQLIDRMDLIDETYHRKPSQFADTSRNNTHVSEITIDSKFLDKAPEDNTIISQVVMTIVIDDLRTMV